MDFGILKQATVPTIADKKVTVNDLVITVKQYIPIDVKFEIVSTVLQAAGDGYADSILGDVLFKIKMIQQYTDIDITQEDVVNLFDTYEVLNKLGLIEPLFNAIPVTEVEEITTHLEKTRNEYIKYRNQVGFATELFIAKIDVMWAEILGLVNNVLDGWLGELVKQQTTLSGNAEQIEEVLNTAKSLGLVQQ